MNQNNNGTNTNALSSRVPSTSKAKQILTHIPKIKENATSWTTKNSILEKSKGVNIA